MTSKEIFDLIVLNIKEIVPGIEHGVIDRQSILSPLGLDSIGRAELIEQTLEDLGLDVPRGEFYTAHNLGELADLFLSKLC